MAKEPERAELGDRGNREILTPEEIAMLMAVIVKGGDIEKMSEEEQAFFNQLRVVSSVEEVTLDDG